MPMIETINLTKKYGDLVALNNLNLSIEQGACFGFIGPNGAGKTITISSHILHELSELCNMVGIIEQGELLFSGSTTEIMARASMGQVVHIVVEDRHELAAQLLAKVKGITKVEVTQHNG